MVAGIVVLASEVAVIGCAVGEIVGIEVAVIGCDAIVDAVIASEAAVIASPAIEFVGIDVVAIAVDNFAPTLDVDKFVVSPEVHSDGSLVLGSAEAVEISAPFAE